MPPGKTDIELAENFTRFFLGKITKIRDDLAGCEIYSPAPVDLVPLNQFQLSVDEETRVIRSMPTKCCESDPIPTGILKQSLDKLENVITEIVNISLHDGSLQSHGSRI